MCPQEFFGTDKAEILSVTTKYLLLAYSGNAILIEEEFSAKHQIVSSAFTGGGEAAHQLWVAPAMLQWRQAGSEWWWEGVGKV